MHPETRMFLINKFLAEVVKPISRIEAARRAKNIASGSGGRLGLGDARKPKLTGMGSGAKGFPLDLGGSREARTLPKPDSKGRLRGRGGKFTTSKKALIPSTTYAAQEPGRILRMQAKKRKEKGPARQTNPEKAGVTKYERGMMAGRGVGAPKPKQPTIRDYSSIKSKVKAGRRKISGAIKTGASKVGDVVSGAAKKTVDAVETQTKPGLDPSIKVSDPRFGTKDGMKPTLASDVLGGIKKAAKATKDTLLKQQVGQQADAYADALNIGGGRRMGPQIGATGLRTDREKGVANIRTGIKQQVGVVTQTDDQGNVKGAKAGVLNPQRILRRIKARQAQKQQDDILNRANRAAEQGDVSGYARELKKVFSDKRVDLPTVGALEKDVTGAPTGRRVEVGFGRRKPSDLGTFVKLQTSLARKRQEIDKLRVERSKATGDELKRVKERLKRLKKGTRRGEEEQAKILSRTRAGRAAQGEEELNQILSKQVTDPDSTREFDYTLPSGDKITIRQKM